VSSSSSCGKPFCGFFLGEESIELSLHPGMLRPEMSGLLLLRLARFPFRLEFINEPRNVLVQSTDRRFEIVIIFLQLLIVSCNLDIVRI
jgi:hypothetical protein